MLPKLGLLQQLVECGVIAVIRRLPPGKAEQVAESLVAGGVTALEVTVDSPGAFDVIGRLAERMKGQAIVGAGTVLDGEAARLAIDSGAQFLFSPSLHRDVIQMALRYGKVAVPGVMTPTEMMTAMEWGADLVKVFPASVIGVSGLKDLKGPFPHVPVIPTGGIHLDNAAAFIQAGASALGVGGNLVDARAVHAADFQSITQTAKRYVEVVQTARAGMTAKT